MEEALKFEVRIATEDDYKFIFHSWRESLRNTLFTHWSWRQFKRDFSKAWDALQGVSYLVAYDPEDPELIFGWIAYRQGRDVLYVYVKHTYRGQGIGDTLFTSVIKEIQGKIGVLFGKHPVTLKVAKDNPDLFVNIGFFTGE